MMIAACSNTNDEVTKFLTSFQQAIASGDKNAIAKLYPTALVAESLNSFQPESATITAERGDTIEVRLTDKMSLTIVRGNDGQMQVVKSVGLFSYDPNRLMFALKTGQYKPSLDDGANAARMADQGFADYLLTEFNNSLRQGMKLANAKTYGDEYYEGEWVCASGYAFTIVNNTSFDIPGSAYSVVYRTGYWGDSQKQTEVVPGVDIAAGGSATVKTRKLGTSMENDDSYSLNINGVTADNFEQIFQPTGTEYDEYLRTHQPTVVEKGALTLNVTGVMGGCGTKLTFNDNKGEMLYNPKSSALEFSNAERREVTLVSYNASTGDLVLRIVKPGGSATGQLNGTWRNGSYQGTFNNVNGKSSSFSFK